MDGCSDLGAAFLWTITEISGLCFFVDDFRDLRISLFAWTISRLKDYSLFSGAQAQKWDGINPAPFLFNQ